MSVATEQDRKTAQIDARKFQGGSSNTRIYLNKNGVILEMDGEEIAVPPGCSQLEIQPRLCGDYYAELVGPGFIVAGFGERASDASKMAIRKMPAEQSA